MVSNPVDATIKRIRGWLGAHVESTVLHAAAELHLLSSLQQEAYSHQELAERYDYEPYSVRVLLDILTGLEFVTKRPDGRYKLSDTLQPLFNQETGMALAASAQGWPSLLSFSPALYAPLLQFAQDVSAHPATSATRLLECAWRYVWSAGMMEAGAQRLLSSLQERPLPFADLAVQRHLSEEDLQQLCIVGQHIEVLSRHDNLVELSQEARRAFGQGSIKEYCRWMEQRLVMERTFFYTPLGQLSRSLRDHQPVSLSSSLGSPANGQFRRTFVRTNRPIIPLLYHVAQNVTSKIMLAQHPIRVLEIGAASGCWGIALASLHPKSQIVAVDTPETLKETQQIVAAAKVQARYTWNPGNMQHIEQETHSYDLIVLNEVCHTVSPKLLVSWLTRIVRMLTAHGVLLIADMVLDADYAGPSRHLLSAIKLLVTGGGQLMNINDYRQILQQAGLDAVQFSRLATTDLILASCRKDQLMVNDEPVE
ncbi:MAG TPA: class I SAM-dependent methyltransferase [Ktedonobacteraceae bacterium]|nr:class I SAM-dependent methyltransferase [Ktedonobacteraceae bacterium]